MGTRIQPFTQHLPKPYLPLLGIPVLQFLLDHLQSEQLSQVALNFHHLPEVSREQIQKLDFGTLRYHLSDESKKLLGSAGGIRQMMAGLGLDRSKKAFFCMNADTVHDLSFKKLEARHAELKKKYGVKATLSVMPKESNPSEEAYSEILSDESGDRVKSWGPQKKGQAYYLGIAVMESEIFHALPVGVEKDLIRDALTQLLKKGEIGIYWAEPLWLDMGSPELWWKAHFQLLELLEGGKLPSYWSQRLEHVNRKIQKMGWIAEGTAIRDSEAIPPYYCQSPVLVKSIGPYSVFYGGDAPVSDSQIPSQSLGWGSCCWDAPKR